MTQLVPTRFLFRFSAQCTQLEAWPTAPLTLGDEFLLPNLSALDGGRSFAEVRLGWRPEGFALSARVEGKRQLPWCRESRPEESDGLRVWFDTRDTRNVHRASRFCHQFIFMPAGSGRGLDEPVAEQLLIHRAKENARPIRPGTLKARREKRVDGYLLECLIPAEALTGYDPVECPRLGFTYAVVDRELGEQTFSCPIEFPYREDPSLWATLVLATR